METVASLIREFPFGSFLIITGIIAGVFSTTRALINRNKPACECECCVSGGDDEDDDEEEDEE